MAAMMLAAPAATAAPSLRVAPRRAGVAAPLSARRAVVSAPLSARAVRFSSRAAAPKAASCSAAVGAVSFGGKGSVGAARFSGASSASSSGKILGLPRFAVFAGIGLGMPILAAISTALNSSVAKATAAAAYKLPIAVTVLSLAIYYYATNQVSVARYKYKVAAPATTGVSADFDRYLRVQANFVEGAVIFLPTLWLSALLVSPAAAAAGGAVWCLGRVLYGQGYYKAANQRGKGFAFVALAQAYLLVLAGIGAVRTFF